MPPTPTPTATPSTVSPQSIRWFHILLMVARSDGGQDVLDLLTEAPPTMTVRELAEMLQKAKP